MKEIFSSEGRYNRAKYWGRLILISIIYVLVIVTLFSTNFVYVPSIALYLTLPYLVVILLCIIKRLHDLDKSGWFALLYFVPLANTVMMIILAFMKGTVGFNEYGEDPLN